IEVVGDAIQKLANEEATLTQVLKTLPKADHVLIGQKGAFERTIGSLGKIRALIDADAKSSTELRKLLSPEAVKLLNKAIENQANLNTFVMKNASGIDKLFEAAKSVLPASLSPTVFNFDRGSYEMADVILAGDNGKPQRWRVFSNVWGDEVLPIAKALKATEHTTISYIGTAGALPGSDLKVGDLVMPKTAMSPDGAKHALKPHLVPKVAKKVDVVTTVSSLFEETKEWLEQTAKKAQVVEVETSHIAKVFNGKNDRVSTMLLISDKVGVEGETLAEASSSARRNAQISAISTILDEAGVSNVVTAKVDGDDLYRWIEEAAPTRDPVSKFQLFKEAEARGISDREALKTFVQNEKSFTTKRLISSIDLADRKFLLVLSELENAGLRPTVAMPRSFLEGRWNPANGPLQVNLELSSADSRKAAEEILSRLSREDKSFTKALKLSISEKAGKEWVALPGFLDNPNGTFLELYKDSAIGFGGLAHTETRTGHLKFVQVAPPTKGKAVTSIAFFKPDEATEQLLRGFNQDSKTVLNVLEEKIQHINSFADPKFETDTHRNWTVKMTKVTQLENGALATIVPELGED
ncbi:MAG: hypothetical protein KGQ59_12540, partial [Bdellovibrionales bacterium]|nr:hypothetical protein [Bdellovibrionales bacterium]